MNRGDRIYQKLTKAGFDKGPLTEKEVDRIIDEYAGGQNAQFRGDTIAGVIDKFFQQVPDVKKSFNADADSIFELGKKNQKRFRNKVLLCLITAYQNGTVDGHRYGGGYNLKGLIEDIQEELHSSPEYKL